MQEELSTGKKSIRQATIRLGFCTLHIGFFTDNAGAGQTSRGLMLKIAGREPKQPGGFFNITYLGIQATRYGDRMKLGFTKRKQTIQKV